MSRDELLRIHDRLEISDLLVHVCRMVDEFDFDRLGEVFAHDGSDNHGAGSVVGIAAIRDWYRRETGNVAACIHNLSNVAIELDGDRASASSNVVSWVWTMDREVGVVQRPADYAVGLTYRDRLVRTNNGWRIAERVLVASPSKTGVQHLTLVGYVPATQEGILALSGGTSTTSDFYDNPYTGGNDDCISDGL